MRNLFILSLGLVMFFVSCKDNNEQPAKMYSLELVGLSSTDVVWDTIYFEVVLSEELDASQLVVSVANEQLYPINSSKTEFILNTYDFPDGNYQLSVSHSEVSEGETILIPFKILNTLITVFVEETAIQENTSIWLVVSDADSEIINSQRVDEAGKYVFQVPGYLKSDCQFSAMVNYLDAPFGVIDYMEHVPRGQELTLKSSQGEDHFGTGNILMKNIPSHTSFMASVLGTEYYGDQIPSTLPMFFYSIPSRVLVQWTQDDNWVAAFSEGKLMEAGGNVEVDLSQTLTVSASEISLPRVMNTSFSTRVFPKADVYTESYFVDLQLIEEENTVTTREITEGFEQVEAQLIFTEGSVFSFYR